MLGAWKKLGVLNLKQLISPSLSSLKRNSADRHQINNQRQFRQQLTVLFLSFFSASPPQNTYFYLHETMKACSELGLEKRKEDKLKNNLLVELKRNIVRCFDFCDAFKRTKLKSKFWKYLEKVNHLTRIKIILISMLTKII